MAKADHKERDAAKVCRVITSCRTMAHLEAADKMVANYEKMHGKNGYLSRTIDFMWDIEMYKGITLI